MLCLIAKAHISDVYMNGNGQICKYNLFSPISIHKINTETS